MGYFKDIHCDLLDLYSKAEANFLLFAKCIKADGYAGEPVYSEDNAIAAAQYYGMMCGYMNAEKAIFSSNVIEEEMKELEDIKLFRKDFEESS